MDPELINLMLKNRRRFLVLGFLRLWFFIVPSSFRRVTFRFFLTVTPRVPVVLSKGLSSQRDKLVFAWAFIYTLLLAFFLTMMLAWLNGTLIGSESNRVYFLQDYQNLALYSVVVPSYVACSFALISTTIQRQTLIRRLAERFKRTPSFSRKARFPIFCMVAPVISAFSTYNYISDVLNNASHTYWFMMYVPAIGNVLNKVGIYYVILNFMLLSILVVANFCFFSLFFEVINVGSSIRSAPVGDTYEWSRIKDDLRYFTRAYMWAKLVCVALVVNISIWETSELGKTQNLKISVVVMCLMGLFFVSFPRYYVEIMWRDYKILSGKAEVHESFEEMRSAWIENVIIVADVILFALLIPHIQIFGSLNPYLALPSIWLNKAVEFVFG